MEWSGKPKFWIQNKQNRTLKWKCTFIFGSAVAHAVNRHLLKFAITFHNHFHVMNTIRYAILMEHFLICVCNYYSAVCRFLKRATEWKTRKKTVNQHRKRTPHNIQQKPHNQNNNKTFMGNVHLNFTFQTENVYI